MYCIELHRRFIAGGLIRFNYPRMLITFVENKILNIVIDSPTK